MQVAPNARRWVAEVLRAGEGEITRDLMGAAEMTPAQALFAAEREGVVGLVHAKLTTCPASPMQAVFDGPVRRQAVQSLWIKAEGKRLLDALAAQGLRVLVLKGGALAWWLYQAPRLRSIGDFDLLFASREDAARAVEILAANGYGAGYAQGDHAYELVRMPVPGTAYALELDVHWRLLNAPVFANALGFETLWQASIPLSALGEHARGLNPVHALCHAAMNRVVNLYTGVGDSLKCLYDIHLLAAHLDQAQWTQLRGLAIDKGLCGVLHSALEAAREELGTQVPAAVLDALAQAMPQESLDPARLGDWGYMQRRSAAALPLGARLRWVWGRLMPDIDYLRRQHGANASMSTLWMSQGRRLLGRLTPGRGSPAGGTVSPRMVAALVGGIVLLLVALLLPGELLSRWFYTDAHAPGRLLIWLEHTTFPFSRWFHVAIFAWLTLCVARIFPQWRWRLVFALLALAVGGELIQIPVPGREAGLVDVLDDLAGIALGLILLGMARIWRGIGRRR